MTLAPSSRTGVQFIILTPAAESTEFRAHRDALQARLGGRAVTPVHFTCQRFLFPEQCCVPEFFSELKHLLTATVPIPIFANAVIPLYSEFRHARVLKWRVEVTPALDQFVAVVEKTLLKNNGRSFYHPNWRSHLVTGLENIIGLDLYRDLDRLSIPNPLFTGQVVQITQSLGPGMFETIDQFDLVG